MSKDNKKSLILPNGPEAKPVTVDTNGSIILVGANGVGKTRLGTWIELESTQKLKVHRISAQKSLAMPEQSATSSLKAAEASLRYGHPNAVTSTSDNFERQLSFKLGHRWQQKPNTFLLNDYDALMVYLFTDEFEASTQYRQDARISSERVEPPKTKLDTIKNIWESILPHRELVISAGKIEVRIKDGETYSASEMSDGERVIFYLIGQCLAAPEEGIIVIDEPELHLHKSIQHKLWQRIESERKDCLFVYLTHDIEFAVAQDDAVILWLKSYDGKTWQFEQITPMEGIPEAVYVEVLGNRRPVIFVEGENGSIDVTLYRLMYPEHLVIPRGSCYEVISSTRAMRKTPRLHRLSILGIVDRDRRNENEAKSLSNDGIIVLDVAEVENLFCTSDVLRIVAKKLKLDPDETLEQVKEYVIRSLKEEIDVQVSLHVASEIRFLLNRFDEKAQGASKLSESLQGLMDQIDVQSMYDNKRREIQSIVDEGNYKGALQVYNRKSLSRRISQFFGFNQGELSEYIIRLLRSEEGEDLLQAFRGTLPDLTDVSHEVDCL